MPKPEFPKFPKGGEGREETLPLEVERREAEGPTGPYGAPRPGEKAPHKDAGQLINDFVGDCQSAGETICDALDQPLDQTINVKGPHRLIDGYLDTISGMARDVVTKVTRWKE